MSFGQYADKPPDAIGNLEIHLKIDELGAKTGTYFFEMVHTGTGSVVEGRSGDLSSVPGAINGTSITLAMISAWLDELRALAEGTLPGP